MMRVAIFYSDDKQELNTMRGFNQFLLTGAVGILLVLTASQAMAQNRQSGDRQRSGNDRGTSRQRPGNFDPAQFQQGIVDRYRERLEVTNAAEWKIIQPLVQKIVDARIASGERGRSSFGRGGGPGGDRSRADQGQSRNASQGELLAEALRKAIEAKAPPAEVKRLLARYLEYRKDKQAELEKARDALRAVLTSRQEAIAVLSGLL